METHQLVDLWGSRDRGYPESTRILTKTLVQLTRSTEILLPVASGADLRSEDSAKGIVMDVQVKDPTSALEGNDCLCGVGAGASVT